MPLNMTNTNNIWINRCDVHVRNHAPKAFRPLWAQYLECSGHFQYTPRIYYEEPIREQEIK